MTYQYVLGGITYTSKASVRRLIQATLSPHGHGSVFLFPALSDLIAGHHHACSRLALRPSCFKKVALPEYPAQSKAYELQGYFDGIGWHDVSWTKCLNPPTYKQEVAGHLRRRVQWVVATALQSRCARCGGGSNLEVDHQEPTFATMVDDAYGLFETHETERWAHHDWLHNARFALPDGHPVVLRFLALHGNARLITLCHPCHAEYGGAR